MKKTLLHTNKYLRDPKLRKAILLKHAVVSANIEGVSNAAKMAEEIMEGRLGEVRQGTSKPSKHNGRHRRIISW